MRATHQVLMYDDLGGELGLTYRDVPLPDPGPEEVRLPGTRLRCGLTRSRISRGSGRAPRTG